MDIKTTKKNSKSNKSRDNICLGLASSCRFQWMSLGSDSPYSWWNCSKYALYLWIKLVLHVRVSVNLKYNTSNNKLTNDQVVMIECGLLLQTPTLKLFGDVK